MTEIYKQIDELYSIQFILDLNEIFKKIDIIYKEIKDNKDKS